MARERQVYDTGQIAHLWAHATQAAARNPQGNFSFQGENLYSYSTVIARRIVRKGTPVFLLTTNTYSNTTNGHQSDARQAAHGIHVYHVADIHATTYAQHKANVLDILARAETAAERTARARNRTEWHEREFRNLVASVQLYAKLFNVRGVKFPSPENVHAIGAAAAERARNAKRAETRATQERNAKRARQTEFLESIADTVLTHWRATGESYPTTFEGESVNIAIDRISILRGGVSFMRLDGEDVVTSMHARVPARIVRRVAPMVLRLMSTAGVDPVYASAAFPGKTLHVGHYAISWWNARAVRVGCHEFTRGEIETILATLERAEIVPAAADETAA